MVLYSNTVYNSYSKNYSTVYFDSSQMYFPYDNNQPYYSENNQAYPSKNELLQLNFHEQIYPGRHPNYFYFNHHTEVKLNKDQKTIRSPNSIKDTSNRSSIWCLFNSTSSPIDQSLVDIRKNLSKIFNDNYFIRNGDGEMGIIEDRIWIPLTNLYK